MNFLQLAINKQSFFELLLSVNPTRPHRSIHKLRFSKSTSGSDIVTKYTTLHIIIVFVSKISVTFSAATLLNHHILHAAFARECTRPKSTHIFIFRSQPAALSGSTNTLSQCQQVWTSMFSVSTSCWSSCCQATFGSLNHKKGAKNTF